MITDNVGGKRINLARKPLKVLLITNEEKQPPEEVFMDREPNASVGRKLITTPLDAKDNAIMKDKLACVPEMVLSLDELNITDHLEDE